MITYALSLLVNYSLLLGDGTEFGKHAFSHAKAATWKSLPPEIGATAGPAVFKKLLKPQFFNIAFSSC